MELKKKSKPTVISFSRRVKPGQYSTVRPKAVNALVTNLKKMAGK